MRLKKKYKFILLGLLIIIMVATTVCYIQNKNKNDNTYEKIMVCYVDTKSLIEEPEVVMGKVLKELDVITSL